MSLLAVVFTTAAAVILIERETHTHTRLNTTLTSLSLSGNRQEEGGEGAQVEALRLITKVTSLNLYYNVLGKGGGRAETLRINTTLTSLDLGDNGMGEEVRYSVLRQAWGDRGGSGSPTPILESDPDT